MKTIIMSKKMMLLNILGACVLFCFSFNYQGNDDWVVPEKYKTMKNPKAANSESLDIGKTLYAKHCKSCHGKYGEGDGPKAAELKSKVGDFTDGSLPKQSDGTLYYKILEGKDDMPSFKKKLEYEEDIWDIVNYVRQLTKN